MKKTVLVLAILVLAGAAVFAQQNDSGQFNTIGMHFGIISAELNYERSLSPNFSLLADVSYSNLLFADNLAVSGKGRWYPFGRAFYLEMGLGYSYGYKVFVDTDKIVADIFMTAITGGLWLMFMDYDGYSTGWAGGLSVQPGLGWKVDIGKKGSFVLPVSLGADIRITGDYYLVFPYFRAGLGFSF